MDGVLFQRPRMQPVLGLYVRAERRLRPATAWDSLSEGSKCQLALSFENLERFSSPKRTTSTTSPVLLSPRCQRCPRKPAPHVLTSIETPWHPSSAVVDCSDINSNFNPALRCRRRKDSYPMNKHATCALGSSASSPVISAHKCQSLWFHESAKCRPVVKPTRSHRHSMRSTPRRSLAAAHSKLRSHERASPPEIRRHEMKGVRVSQIAVSEERRNKLAAQMRQELDVNLFQSPYKQLISTTEQGDFEWLHSNYYPLTQHGRSACALLQSFQLDSRNKRSHCVFPWINVKTTQRRIWRPCQSPLLSPSPSGLRRLLLKSLTPSTTRHECNMQHCSSSSVSPLPSARISVPFQSQTTFGHKHRLDNKSLFWNLPARSCLSDSNATAKSLSNQAYETKDNSETESSSPLGLCLFGKTLTPSWVLAMNKMFANAATSKVRALANSSISNESLKSLEHQTFCLPCDRKNLLQFSRTLSTKSCLKSPDQTTPGKINKLKLLRLLYLEVAATIIQKYVRGYQARRRYETRLKEATITRSLNDYATRIQCVWRAYTARWEVMLRTHLKMHNACRQVAARRIQCAWRSWKARQELKVRQLADMIWKARQISAVTIQRVWRAHQVRKIVDEEWDNWVVKWIWDPPGMQVEVVGDFTSPPWFIRVPMKWCSIRRCYVAVLPREQGRYELKFLVEGRFVCCGAGTVVDDGSGHYNNVVDVFKVQLDSPFRRSREILHAINTAYKKSSYSQSETKQQTRSQEPDRDLTVGSATPLQRLEATQNSALNKFEDCHPFAQIAATSETVTPTRAVSTADVIFHEQETANWVNQVNCSANSFPELKAHLSGQIVDEQLSLMQLSSVLPGIDVNKHIPSSRPNFPLTARAGSADLRASFHRFKVTPQDISPALQPARSSLDSPIDSQGSQDMFETAGAFSQNQSLPISFRAPRPDDQPIVEDIFQFRPSSGREELSKRQKPEQQQHHRWSPQCVYPALRDTAEYSRFIPSEQVHDTPSSSCNSSCCGQSQESNFLSPVPIDSNVCQGQSGKRNLNRRRRRKRSAKTDSSATVAELPNTAKKRERGSRKRSRQRPANRRPGVLQTFS